MDKQIAVIMPVYKAHDTIKRTLSSIAMQSHIDFNVYLMVDGEEEGSYDYLHDLFDKLIDMNIYYLSKNAGPGVARQQGIEISKEPYITFIDADDTYLSSLALYYQHKPFDDNIAVVSCSFLEEKSDYNLHLRENDMVWMHGKMYRRSFLDKYGIAFNDTRANEDVGFNTQCQCFANEHEQIFLSKDTTYLWQWRDTSIVRSDNQSYAFNESIDGYVTNKIYAFNRVIAQDKLDDAVKFFILCGLSHLFRKYLIAMMKAPKRLRHIKKWAKVYYDELYDKVDQEYKDKAEASIIYKEGLRKPEHFDEYKKWLKMISRYGNK